MRYCVFQLNIEINAMYNFFELLVTEEEDTQKKRRKKRKKKDTNKPAHVVEQAQDIHPIDEEPNPSDDEVLDNYVPGWAQRDKMTDMSELVDSVILSAQKAAEENAKLREALLQLTLLNKQLIKVQSHLAEKVLKLEAMQKHRLTDDEYNEQYEQIHGASCVIS